LTDPERTSPTAKTPGTVVSSGDAGRSAFCPSCAPVSTKAAAIDPDAAAVEPAGRRIGADEQEQIADIEAMLFPATAAAPAHPLQRRVRAAFKPDHLGVEHQFDIVGRLDPLDQIARHAGAKAAATDDHVDLARVARQEHRGLSGGIAAPTSTTS